MPTRLRFLLAAVVVAGCAPRSTARPLPNQSAGAVAIQSSDLGLRLDPKMPGRILIFEPLYDATGEEKLRAPRVGPPRFGPEFRPVRSDREGNRITMEFRDGKDGEGRQSVTLSADGRTATEMWSVAGAPAGTAIWKAASPALPALPPAKVSIRIVSNDPRDDRAANVMLRDLLAPLRPSARMSVAPFGLTNDLYFGHVFWDADVWLFPAVALLDPAGAAAIPQYRIRMLAAARRNFAAWLAAGRPTARSLLGRLPDPPPSGAMYPWESSVTGRETVPGETRYEHHITGSVAWSVSLAADLGLVPEPQARAVLDGAAGFYRARRQGGSIPGVVSPDESHVGDNDLYTNLLADWTMAGGSFPAAPTLILPRDARSFLTYAGDRVRGYKQAAALLAIYPLQYEPAERQAKAMLDRFAPKVSPNGPAMSDAIHAIVAARAGDPERALGYWRAGWRPFLDLATGMFSEKRRSRREDFLTGEAGAIQAILFGFAGLRIGPPRDGDRVLLRLRRGKVLSASPRLPRAWRRIEVKGLSVMGRRYDFVAEFGRATLTASR